MGNWKLSILALIAVALSSCGGSGSEHSTSEKALGEAVSLWSDAEVPGAFATQDSSAMELGLKFRTSVPGNLTGVRFYKALENTGTHVGSLWTEAGSPLASVTFSNETASGWQSASFAAPVALQPGTVYVVSYFAPNGHYAGESGYFAAAGRTSGP